MATQKKRTLVLSNDRVIKMAGNSITITPTLEVGEGFTTSILGLVEVPEGDNRKRSVANPFGLTVEDVIELADYNIRLWMDLKDNVREKGVRDIAIFRRVNVG
ncbi:hypothetical protein [Chitinophaga barathri]|uniref:Uncharacterized protein n=1 Tax=Chitinophaga barathri TaxID=1647451 RepID=A0A3N4MGX7_9BACT|nr:hypothetical protein [Chitinophaga barathri]RPD43121.1 hypothetical protein EG028_02165 [Chitinophaga barathri]